MTTEALKALSYIKAIKGEAICRGCGESIVWCVTTRDKFIPMDKDGQPHWSSCSKAHDFKRRP